jgi:type IV pilus assembly protein PilV
MNTSAYHRTQANTLAYDILDAMRTNRAAALAGSYNVAFEGTHSGSGQAASDVADWLLMLNFLLPMGAGEVDCDNATQVCRVTVVWDDVRAMSSGNCKSEPEKCQQLTVSTRI